MVESILEFVLGPAGQIGDFYFQYQHIFNPIVIAAALIKLMMTKKKEAVQGRGV